MKRDVRTPRLAQHEAGHAVAANRLNVPYGEVTLIRNGSALGAIITAGSRDVDQREQAERLATVFCSGYAAMVAAGNTQGLASAGCGSDFKRAQRLIDSWGLAPLDQWKARAVELMSSAVNVRAVSLVAEHLLAHLVLDKEYVDVLINVADGETTEEEFEAYLRFSANGRPDGHR